MNSARPKIVVLDVDGVMTTGQFLYSQDGKEYKVFGPHDNDGLKMIQNHMKIIFVTADKRGYPISKKRIVDDMNFELFLVGETQRLAFLQKKFDFEHMVYIGDGYHDAPILKQCMYGIAPQNARIEAKEAADFVTPSRSGEDAVLDACLHIIHLYFERGTE